MNSFSKIICKILFWVFINLALFIVSIVLLTLWTSNFSAKMTKKSTKAHICKNTYFSCENNHKKLYIFRNLISMVAMIGRHNFEILNKMHKKNNKNQILLKPLEINLGTIHLKVIPTNSKANLDKWWKNCNASTITSKFIAKFANMFFSQFVVLLSTSLLSTSFVK